MKIDKKRLLEGYRILRTIREFEERVCKEFMTGLIPGFVHLFAGEEASATVICRQLGEHDTVASTHRGHSHAIAEIVPLRPSDDSAKYLSERRHYCAVHHVSHTQA